MRRTPSLMRGAPARGRFDSPHPLQNPNRHASNPLAHARRACARAVRFPSPAPALPPHSVPTDLCKAILAQFGTLEGIGRSRVDHHLQRSLYSHDGRSFSLVAIGDRHTFLAVTARMRTRATLSGRLGSISACVRAVPANADLLNLDQTQVSLGLDRNLRTETCTVGERQRHDDVIAIVDGIFHIGFKRT